MRQVGYSLVDTANGTELMDWAQTDPPAFIRLSSGDDVHCPSLNEPYGEQGRYMLVPRYITGLPPAPWVPRTGETVAFDGTSVVVSQLYEPSLDVARAAIVEAASVACDARMAALKVGYPVAERDTWDQQAAEARAVTDNPAAATPLLDALATARGIEKVDLVARVLSKASSFAQFSGAVVGRRQAIEDAADATETVRRQAIEGGMDAAEAERQSLQQLLSIDLDAGWPV